MINTSEKPDESREVILPRVPRPHNDELLGSWFTRVANANEPQTWDLALRRSGTGRPRWSRTDVGLPDPPFLRLLTALGTTYQRVTAERTTWPFWLAFDGSPEKAVEVDGVKIQMRQGRRRGGAMRAVQRDRALWFCPACLKEDHEYGSESYWRRSHQLPTALVCHQHGCLLRSACPTCGADDVIALSRLMPLPRATCGCGTSLCEIQEEQITLHRELILLAQFSADALNNGMPTWDVRHVCAVITQIINERYGGVASEVAVRLLQEKFGFIEASRRRLDLQLGHGSSGVSVAISGSFSNWSAEGRVCLFVAMGLRFAEVKELLLSARPPLRSVSLRRLEGAERLERAKRALETLYSKRGTLSAVAGAKSSFWLVCIHDPEWLVRRFGFHPARLELPSVQEDRASIRTTLNAGRESKNIGTSASAIRSRMRDWDWYSRATERYFNKPVKDGVESSSASRIKLLDEAIEKCLSSTHRPGKVSVNAIAKAGGVNADRIRRYLRQEPVVRERLRALNASWPERRIRWYLDLMIADGVKESSSQVLDKLGIRDIKSAKGSLEALCRERLDWAERVLPLRAVAWGPSP
jgi:hypothetical protein